MRLEEFYTKHLFKPLVNYLDTTTALISWAVMGAGIHYSEKKYLEMGVDQIVDVLTQCLVGIGIFLT